MSPSNQQEGAMSTELISVNSTTANRLLLKLIIYYSEAKSSAHSERSAHKNIGYPIATKHQFSKKKQQANCEHV